ncbi:ABC transporter permease [Pseudarthrobacter sp. So.54]
MTCNAAVVVASADDADQLGAALLGAVDALEIIDVTIKRVPAADVRNETRASGADLGIIIPEGFSNAVLSGQAASVQLIQGDGATLESGVLIAVVQGVVDQFAAGTVTAAMRRHFRAAAPGTRGTCPAGGGRTGPAHPDRRAGCRRTTLAPRHARGRPGRAVPDVHGRVRRVGPARGAEQGTLARLRSMPVTSSAVITAKACTGFILGVVATTVLLTAGSQLFRVSFGSPLVVAALILSVVTAATSLTFVVARLVRTAEQANVAQSILAMVLGIAGGAFSRSRGPASPPRCWTSTRSARSFGVSGSRPGAEASGT